MVVTSFVRGDIVPGRAGIAVLCLNTIAMRTEGVSYYSSDLILPPVRIRLTKLAL